MTPLEILIAIHHAVGVGEYKPAAPIVSQIEERMCRAGLLRLRQVREPGMSTYEATAGLALYLKALRSVPWPVQVWQMPEPQETARGQENHEVAP